MIDFIKGIIKTDAAIFSLYEKMRIMELNGNKIEEQEKLFDYLKIALEVEKNKLDEKKYTQKDWYDIYNLTYYITPENEVEYYARERILFLITQKHLMKDEEIAKTIPPYMLEICKMVGFDENHEIERFTRNKKVENELDFDMAKLFLHLLNKDLKEEFKEEAIELKYRMLFQFPNIEESLIDDHFNLSRIILTSKLNATLMGSSEREYNYVKSNYTISKASKEVGNLLTINDEIDKFRIYSNRIALRSALTLMDDETLRCFEERFAQFITDHSSSIIGASMCWDEIEEVENEKQNKPKRKLK